MPASGHTKVLKITDKDGNYNYAETINSNLFAQGSNWIEAPMRYLRLEFTIINPSLHSIYFMNVVTAYTDPGVYSIEA